MALGQNSAVEGLGAQKCAVVSEAAQSNQTRYAALGVWVSGFLTAANKYEADTFDLTPWQPPEVVMAQITSACKNKPEATLAQVTIAYIEFLRNDRLIQQSDFVALRRDGQQTFLYMEVVNRIRDRLMDKGYETPEITVNKGQDFLDVIARFQQDHGINESGLPDLETISRILE